MAILALVCNGRHKGNPRCSGILVRTRDTLPLPPHPPCIGVWGWPPSCVPTRKHLHFRENVKLLLRCARETPLPLHTEPRMKIWGRRPSRNPTRQRWHFCHVNKIAKIGNDSRKALVRLPLLAYTPTMHRVVGVATKPRSHAAAFAF